MGPSGENSDIVRTILSLAENLGLTVVAEGFETGDQLAHLRLMDCPAGQGYFFSRPLPAAAATSLIADAPRW
jgi:EAL domain-containing protein (putative c-di-GMP-specific phosphodiesterase class I)